MMFGGDFLKGISPLQRLIARAADPYKVEPDYALHLEIAEYINQKKANTYVLLLPTFFPDSDASEQSKGGGDDDSAHCKQPEPTHRYPSSSFA